MFYFLNVFQGFTDDQLMLVEQNTVMVEEREREIRQIVQSISDLNEIFRDLAGMVVEQVFRAKKKVLQHIFKCVLCEIWQILFIIGAIQTWTFLPFTAE